MGDNAPAPTAPDLNALADEVLKNGRSDDEVVTAQAAGLRGMAKAVETITGMASEMLTLLKGGKADDDDDDDDDDTSDDDGDDDDTPGYRMNKGDDVEPASGPVDATEIILGLYKAVPEILSELAALRAENAVLRKAQGKLADMMVDTAKLLAQGHGDLTKAVVETRAALANTPVAARTPNATPRLADPPAPEPKTYVGTFIGGSKRAEKKLLAKAVDAGIISDLMCARFPMGRRFSTNEAENADLIAKVTALVPAN